MRKLIVFLLLIVSISSVDATTYYVRKDGNDSCNGTVDAGGSSGDCAKLTVQAGVNLASAGDTVQVAVGDYSAVVPTFTTAAAGTSGSRITIKAKTGDTVSLSRFVVSHAYNTIDGFRILSSSTMTTAPGAKVDAAWTTIQNCTFYGTSRGDASTALIFSGGTYEGTQILSNTFDGVSNGESTSTTIAVRLSANNNCRIAYNTIKDFNSIERAFEIRGSGLQIDHNHGYNWTWTIGGSVHPDIFQWWGAGETMANIVIEQNYFHDIDAQIGNVRWSPTNNNDVTWIWRNNVFANITQGLFNWEVMYFYNNTFYRCATGADNVVFSSSYGGVAHFRNNAFVGCGTGDAYNKGWYDGVGTGGSADYDFVSTAAGAAKSGFTGDETHGISGGTTGFVTPLSNCTSSACNFNIGETSDFIDAGVAVATFSNDYNGYTRPSGAAWDIGAYEFEADAPANDTTVTAAADYDTNLDTVELTGSASDSDGVSSVAYVNSRGGSGSCTGTTSWTCSDVALYNGLNTITITATDVLGYTGTDQIIVTYYEPVENNTTISVTGPQLVYIKGPNSNFKITGSVNAASDATNSFYIDIGSDPAAVAAKSWHIDLTDGYENHDARWGTYDNPSLYQDPTIWLLSGSNQILYIREREAGTLIQSVKFVSTAEDATAPSVSISTSSPQTIYSDSLTVSGTASDAVWGTGSTCKYRIGAEPDADNGTACTGTTSISCETSGYAEGTNTLYVECADAVPNWSTGNSITVYYIVPPATPFNSLRGASFGGTLK